MADVIVLETARRRRHRAQSSPGLRRPEPGPTDHVDSERIFKVRPAPKGAERSDTYELSLIARVLLR